MPRVDAALKVTGAARFVADEGLDAGTLHASWIGSGIANGRVRAANLSAVERMPGVALVLTHATMPRLAPPPLAGRPAWFGEDTAPMQDDRVAYVGQPVAIVVAKTPAQAEHAARALKIAYEAAPPLLGLSGEASLPEVFGEELKLQQRRGDADAAFASAAIQVTSDFETPSNHHAPIEVAAAVATWDGDRLDLRITSRGVVQMREVVAHAFGLPVGNVRVHCPIVGGAFGAKGWLFDHALATAAAARVAGRPVRLVVTREQMFESQGRRGITHQTVALGASRDGRLASVRHDTVAQTSLVAPYYTEKAGAMTPQLYAVPTLSMEHRLVTANVSSPTPMRGPGEAPGSFACEVALDELAEKLGLDPMELRLRNLPRAGDPGTGKPWTSFNAEACWRRGAETFGWASRDPRPGATRVGDELVGWGCATAAYPAARKKASANAALFSDGTVEVRLASHDAGHGTYTALTIVACEALGVAPDRVRVFLGDTRYPEAPVSGGSSTLASAGPAVIAACAALKARVSALAASDGGPFSGMANEQLTVVGGRVVLANDAGRSEDWTAPLRRAGLDRVDATAQAGKGEAPETHGTYSFGAHFVEARVHPILGRARVTRYVGIYDIGRVLAPVQARSQIFGGVLFAIGQALMEHGVFDDAGRLATSDLGSYHVPTCADVPPEFVVEFIDAPDTVFNPVGSRGVGEIGVSGTAGAIANAVFHATGKRVRELPITVERLL